ncbi:MAG: peptidylprolyl isomerase [Candidatus Altiarchaeota archaeon]|nr:peptidylprolyl isomerase [Candidatus Altiarchaeota archaeon]
MAEFIKISYTGSLDDGRVFDTTSEEVAKKEGIYDEKRVYGFLYMIVGEGQVIKGLDEALKDMKVGEEKTVKIPPEKAYGKRNPELIRIVPLKKFKEQKINPIPGMPIDIDGQIARVQTVAGGRVRVDFNHELAGRTLTFNAKVEVKAETEDDKVKFLLEKNFNKVEGFNSKVDGQELSVTIPEKAYKDRNLLLRKAAFSAEAFKHLNIGKITFCEVWGKPEKKK